MNRTTMDIDDLCATRVATDTHNAANHGAAVAQDARPRTYKALTTRPAGFEGVFKRLRQPSLGVTPTYTALKERPADFTDFFAPPRRLFARTKPSYKAPTEAPGKASTGESAAVEVPGRIDDTAA